MINHIEAIFESDKINRIQFLLGAVLLFLISGLVVYFSGGLGVVTSLMKILGMVILLILMRKRCSDIGRPKYWFLLGIVPVISWWLWIECLFFKGKDNG